MHTKLPHNQKHLISVLMKKTGKGEGHGRDKERKNSQEMSRNK